MASSLVVELNSNLVSWGDINSLSSKTPPASRSGVGYRLVFGLDKAEVTIAATINHVDSVGFGIGENEEVLVEQVELFGGFVREHRAHRESAAANDFGLVFFGCLFGAAGKIFAKRQYAVSCLLVGTLVASAAAGDLFLELLDLALDFLGDHVD